MRTTMLITIILMLILTGCNSAGPTQPEAAPPTEAASSGSSTSNTGSFFAVNEIGVGSNGYISLTNFTDQPANLNGLFLCQGKKCFKLPNVEVAAGTTVRVAVGDGKGLEGVVATNATIGELRPADGEIALYTSENVNDSKSILLYLEWGSTPHDNTATAIEAGIWVKGVYAPTTENATRLYRNEGGLWLFDE